MLIKMIRKHMRIWHHPTLERDKARKRVSTPITVATPNALNEASRFMKNAKITPSSPLKPVTDKRSAKMAPRTSAASHLNGIRNSDRERTTPLATRAGELISNTPLSPQQSVHHNLSFMARPDGCMLSKPRRTLPSPSGTVSHISITRLGTKSQGWLKVAQSNKAYKARTRQLLSHRKPRSRQRPEFLRLWAQRVHETDTWPSYSVRHPCICRISPRSLCIGCRWNRLTSRGSSPHIHRDLFRQNSPTRPQ